MRKITVLSMITLDGVMQAPSGIKEDTSANFKFVGWTEPYNDEDGGKIVKTELKQTSDYLLGRKTFEIWEDFWPNHLEFWPGINEGTKYVISNTRNKTAWKNTEFIKNVADIQKIKNSEGSEIQVWGSSELVNRLLKNDLVNELKLKIYPLVLGKGKKYLTTLLSPLHLSWWKVLLHRQE